MEVTISNRQRKVAVDSAWFEAMTARVSEELCKNLRANPAEGLDASFIDWFERRGNISLVLVSNPQIRKLNREWRQKDSATDVLSFPLEMEPPPEGIPWDVGEIVISMERAVVQAKEYGHQTERELAFLFIHGLLHVLGFDHETPEDEKEMFGRQRAILHEAGFGR